MTTDDPIIEFYKVEICRFGVPSYIVIASYQEGIPPRTRIAEYHVCTPDGAIFRGTVGYTGPTIGGTLPSTGTIVRQEALRRAKRAYGEWFKEHSGKFVIDPRPAVFRRVDENEIVVAVANGTFTQHERIARTSNLYNLQDFLAQLSSVRSFINAE